MGSLNIILESYPGTLSEEEKKALAEEKNAYYRRLLQEEMSGKDLSPEVKETMDRMRRKGLLLALGSSSKNARLILSRIAFRLLRRRRDGTDITRSKTDPEVFPEGLQGPALSPGRLPCGGGR
jgi:beta-phosphoglucomutase-like phosphatase (HAD superfamily)